MANFVKEWSTKEVEALTRSYRRYSSVVSLLKYILPAVVVVLILVMFVFSDAPETGSNIVLEPAKNGKPSKEMQLMLNPRFHGVDSRNQPYNIFAKTAFQESKELVTMSEINADLSTSEGSWASMVADSGNYNIQTQYLELFGEVNIFVTEADFSGYEMYTSETKIDVKNRLAHGNEKVYVKSDLGDFTATGFKVDMAQEKIAFTGPIKLVIYR